MFSSQKIKQIKKLKIYIFILFQYDAKNNQVFKKGYLYDET